MRLPEMQLAIKSGQVVDHSEFSALFQKGVDFSEVLKLRKLWSLNKANEKGGDENSTSIRVAVTGSGTLDFVADCLQDSLTYSGTVPSLFVSNYNNYVQDLMEPKSELHNFNPDCLVFIIDSSTVWDLAYSNQTSGEDSISGLIQTKLEFIAGLLKPFSDKGCDVFITNAIHEPVDSPGPIRRRHSKSSWQITEQWNSGLDALSSSGFSVIDVCFLAMRQGLKNAFSFKQWFESKLPYSMNFHATVASEVAFEIAGIRAADKKVLVLDCDNTIWGGVVGDDGIDGIEIGTISSRAQAFQGLQQHIKRLKNLGFLLAISSKNEKDVVMEVFREHAEMILREDDVVCFKVNWRSKADNIAEIAEELNLGLDSFVFLDDNPAEISIVNRFLPDVKTILASEDPVQTLESLHSSRLLYRSSISADDIAKTKQYIAEKKRKTFAASVTDYGEYLSSLEMHAEISPITKATASRASQLINKSNQFNLTTIRKSEAEVLALLGDPNWGCYVVRLQDKFGDHGIISVLLVELMESQLLVETFVMSCRVLKRGVESLIVNFLSEVAKSKDMDRIKAAYRATQKNKIVETLYEDLGFNKLSEEGDEKKYSLDLSDYDLASCHIQVNANY